MWIWLLCRPHIPRDNALQLFSMWKSLIYFTVAMHLQFYGSLSSLIPPLRCSLFFMHPCAHCVVFAHAITCWHVCSFCSILFCPLYHLYNTSDTPSRVRQLIARAWPVKMWLFRVHACIFYMCICCSVCEGHKKYELSLRWISLHAAGPPF